MHIIKPNHLKYLIHCVVEHTQMCKSNQGKLPVVYLPHATEQSPLRQVPQYSS